MVILFCCYNYRLYIFNPHLRRFSRHLKILPSAGLILKAQIRESERERDERGAVIIAVLSNEASLCFSFSFCFHCISAFVEKALRKPVAEAERRKTDDPHARHYP